MIYVIMYRGVTDGETQMKSGGDVGRAAAFLVGAVAAGVSTGAALGWLGSLFPLEVRAGLAGAVAIGGLSLGLWDVIAERRLWIPQLDRETNQRWLHRHALRGAVLTGAVLGAGFLTRISHWLWYVVPVGCFLEGSPAHGVAIYGTYALVRAAIPVIFALSATVRGRNQRDSVSPNRVQELVFRQWGSVPVRRICGACLIVVSTTWVLT